MNNPYFSIVIPTKNRSFLVKDAIKSVLMQTFKDFELILVDNDDSDKTNELMLSFDDKRIQYFRTGGLSMPDNWEFGLDKARGEYIAVIEDKMAFKTDSLEKISGLLEKEKPQVAVWKHDLYDSETGKVIFPYKSVNMQGKSYFASSDIIVQSLMDCDFEFFNSHSPRGLNSCLHRKLAESIRQGGFNRLCVPVSPDYTLAYQQLNSVSNILVINDFLVTMGGLKYGTGLSSVKKGELVKQYLKEIGIDEPYLYNHVPIKVVIAWNSMLNDFFNVASVMGGRFQEFKLNLKNYFVFIYDRILLTQTKFNVDMILELGRWEEALSKQDAEVVDKVSNEIRAVEAKYCTADKSNQQLDVKKTLRWGIKKINKILKRTKKKEKIYKSLIEYITE